MEIRPLVPLEIPTARQEQFLQALSSLPKNGIAFRGDPIRRIEQIQKEGLHDKQSKYIPLVPPNIIPKVWGKEAEELYRNLWSGVDYALTFSDEISSGAFSYEAVKFKSFSTYFDSRKENLPGISVFTAQENQFIEASKNGSTFYGPDNTEFQVGSVNEFGPILKINVKSPITLSLDDIKRSEEQIITELMSEKPDEVIKQIAIAKLYESYKGPLKSVLIKLAQKKSINSFKSEEQDIIKTEYLKHKKKQFFAILTDTTMERLLQEIIDGLS